MASLARTPLARQLARPSPVLADTPRLRIALVEPAWQAYLSGDPDDAAFLAAAKDAFGAAPPLEPNRVAGDAIKAFWLAPGQWLLVGQDRAPPSTVGFVSEVGDGLAVFELSGPAARDILAMGCALDLDGPGLAPGRCARTNFAELHVLLYAHGSRDRFRLHVERQFALHLAEWLECAATACA